MSDEYALPQGRRAVVLGLGMTGLSLARHLARHGARVRVADTRSDPPNRAALARRAAATCRVETGPIHATRRSTAPT